MSLIDFLKEHRSKNPVSFHMPGHKGMDLYRRFGYNEFLEAFLDWDITEIEGADNLFQMEGVLKDITEKYQELYQVDKSYLLINGTSGGLISSILATVPKGGKIIMARNCHKSIFNSLWLGDITPVYAYPEEGQVAGPITKEEVENLLKENKDASAVVLPSPNYYGICSDIENISQVVHKYGKILIVDQAHGAHLKLFSQIPGDRLSMPMPKAAEDCGADIVVNSIHKTLGSMTQSALLNVKGDRVDLLKLEDKLQGIQSTSPSYILMSSLEVNAELMKNHGIELASQWAEDLSWFYKKAKEIPGLHIPDWPNMDYTKINMEMNMAGEDLDKKLIEQNIFTELYTGTIVMAMTGIGNKREDYQRLLDGLWKISKENKDESNIANWRLDSNWKGSPGKTRVAVKEIGENHQWIDLDKSQGKICALSIIPYPPGIPYRCPGEEITVEDIEYITYLRKKGVKVIGITQDYKVKVSIDG